MSAHQTLATGTIKASRVDGPTGMLEAVTAWQNDDATGDIRSQVRFAYDGWGNVATSWQSHDGAAVTTGDEEDQSPHVHYAYDDAEADLQNPVDHAAPYVRLKYVEYPDGDRVVYYNYPAAGTVGGVLSRLDNIASSAAPTGQQKYVAYTYLGAGTIVQVDHPGLGTTENPMNLALSYGSCGTYAGWDRFGRIVDQTWKVNGTPVDSYTYTYDRNSNRTARANELNEDLSETYAYDDLDRLSCTCRDAADFQSWGLDALGNWAGYVESDGQTTTLDQTRTHDEVNQIGEIAATCGPDWVDPAYDAAGNMILAPRPGQESCACEALLLVYDGWNRLAKVYEDTDGDGGEIDEGDTLIAEYVYDGQNRRVVKIVRVVDEEETVTYVRTDYQYNESWQCLEERTDTFEDLEGEGGARETVATVVSVQYLPDIRYIDAMVLRWRYDGETTEVLYLCQDANYNTTALIAESTGLAVERTSFAAYGQATFYGGDWSTRSESMYASEILYASYRFDPETGMYQVRFRYYHPTLAAWTSRDIPYIDGMNLYTYCGSNPLGAVDPAGLLPEVVGGIRTYIEDAVGATRTRLASVLGGIRTYIEGNDIEKPFGRQLMRHYVLGGATPFDTGVSISPTGRRFEVRDMGGMGPSGYEWASFMEAQPEIKQATESFFKTKAEDLAMDPTYASNVRFDDWFLVILKANRMMAHTLGGSRVDVKGTWSRCAASPDNVDVWFRDMTFTWNDEGNMEDNKVNVLEDGTRVADKDLKPFGTAYSISISWMVLGSRWEVRDGVATNVG